MTDATSKLVNLLNTLNTVSGVPISVNSHGVGTMIKVFTKMTNIFSRISHKCWPMHMECLPLEWCWGFKVVTMLFEYFSLWAPMIKEEIIVFSSWAQEEQRREERGVCILKGHCRRVCDEMRCEVFPLRCCKTFIKLLRREVVGPPHSPRGRREWLTDWESCF